MSSHILRQMRLQISVNVPCHSVCDVPPSSGHLLQEYFSSNLIIGIDGECLAHKGRMKLDSAKDHVWRCPEVEVVCLLCSEKLQSKHQGGHDCPMREIVCNCGEKFHKKDDEHHQHLCSFKEIECPFDCGEVVERYVENCM